MFFTDVRIPDSQRLGAVGDGWKVSLTTLMNERYTIGGRLGVGVEDIFELARKVELDDGPALKNEAVREKLADWYVSSQGLKYSALPHHDGAVAGRHAGTGIVDRQAGQRLEAAEHRRLRHGPAWSRAASSPTPSWRRWPPCSSRP